MTEKPNTVIMSEWKQERDRAVGAVLLMAWEGVISMSRAAGLLGMSLLEIREEFKRLSE